MTRVKDTYPKRIAGTASEKRKLYMREYYLKHREEKVQYSREHRDWSRDRQFRKRYGITLLEVERLKSKPCCICGRASEVIDHNHSTGKVRGALCHRCNTGIGFFKENPALMRFAAVYIEGKW